MSRFVALIAAALLCPLPLCASEVQAGEPLVMRIIFEDCLGYIRHGRVPFQGLATRPAHPERIRELPARMPDREKSVELLSPRYVASWGEDMNARHCRVSSSHAAGVAEVPALLGVPAKGFLERVTARAAAEGMREGSVADELSPLSVNSWSEPQTDEGNGARRHVSFSLVATTRADARGMVDAGIIVMGGPPGGHH